MRILRDANTRKQRQPLERGIGNIEYKGVY
jgi:hypothetical protein